MTSATPASTAPDTSPAPFGRLHAAAALALLSVTAGFLHAAVIDAHRGHGSVATVFTAVAIFQVAWAGLVLAKPTRPVLLLGAAANAAYVGAWALSRTSGISFISGLEDKEAVGFTDMTATALEAVLVVGALALALKPLAARAWPTGTAGALSLGALALVVAGIGVPAAAAGGDHDGNGHAHGDEVAADDHTEGDDHAHADGDDHGTTDHADDHGDHALDGAAAATPEEVAAAEALLAETKDGLWQWVDEEKRYAAGFRTIGDGLTGTEHEINWEWINDDVVLDPDKPESLVFRVTPDGKKVLEAAMYMAPAGTPDDEVPDVGGPITQWHIHDNLCFSEGKDVDGALQHVVVGLTSPDGTCRRGVSLQPFAPMLHVWVVPHECGPFSSLEGVGAGQAISEEVDPEADPACNHSGH